MRNGNLDNEVQKWHKTSDYTKNYEKKQTAIKREKRTIMETHVLINNLLKDAL